MAAWAALSAVAASPACPGHSPPSGFAPGAAISVRGVGVGDPSPGKGGSQSFRLSPVQDPRGSNGLASGEESRRPEKLRRGLGGARDAQGGHLELLGARPLSGTTP